MMEPLRDRLKNLARKAGADLVGITSRERLADAPASGDPAYVLPRAHSVVSFAVALNQAAARRFVAKEDWIGHGQDRKRAVKALYTIGDRLVDLLREEGFEAVNVEINNRYRPEPGAADVTEMTGFYPDFSHRYAALAAGLGRLGWSGNLMTPAYGSLVELGSVVTSARLMPDSPLEESPCDRCLACVLSCPVEMMKGKEKDEIRAAGITDVIAAKRPNTCCWIGCSGYEGLSRDGRWSNWSPYRLGLPLPEDKDELDALCVKLQKADPQMQAAENVFNDYRAAVFDPEWFYYTVCGFCRTVCLPDRKDRLELRARLHRSGVAALRPDGMHVVAEGDTVELETPFGVRVVLRREDYENLRSREYAGEGSAARWPLDREVLAWLFRRAETDGE